MNIDIFGSCITRDPFELENNRYTVNNYFARSSLLSLMYKPIQLNIDAVKWPSNFVKRTVNDDLLKRFATYSKAPKSNVIVIDLIQERYSLSSFKDSWYTYSAYHKKAEIPRGEFISGEKHLNLFKSRITDISKFFKEYQYVIIHEANLAEKYIDEDGQEVNFKLTEKDKFFIESGQEYYNLLKDNLDNAYTLSLKGYNGANKHKWGLSPSHYENEYYEKFNEGLEYILSEKKDFYNVK